MCSLEIVKDFLFNNLTPLPSLHIKPATPPLPRSLLKWNCSLLRTERNGKTVLLLRTERNDKTEERERNDLAERNDFKNVGNPVKTDTKGEQY